LALSLPRKLLYAGVVTGMVLGAAELAARPLLRRIGFVSIPEDSVAAHIANDAMAWHPRLGWVRHDLPNPVLGLNEQGFRYGPVQPGKPAAGWRAFALGDSQTYGAGVQAAESWPAHAELTLRSLAERDPEPQLINAGISGYTSLQAKRLIELVLLDYDPDLIIIDCYPEDSLRDDLSSSHLGGSLLDRLTFHSRLVWVLRFGLDRLRPSLPQGMHPQQGHHDPRPRLGNHALVMELGQAEGFEVLFVDYPFMEGDDIKCLAPPQQLPPGAHVAAACTALQASGLPASELFLDANHMSARGCAIAGEAVGRAIVEQGLLP
jgi:hypothetical protein